MNTKILLILTMLTAFSMYPAFATEQSFSIQPFLADTELTEQAAQITAAVAKEFSCTQTDTPPEKAVFPSDVTDQAAIDAIAEAGDKAKSDNVIAGRLTKNGSYYTIDVCVISTGGKKIIYESVLPVKTADADYDPAFDICGRIKLFNEAKTFPVANLAASKGLPQPSVKITWDPVKDCSLYEIFSSAESETGPWISAGTSPAPAFTDAAAKPGIKIWYSISPIINGVKTDLSPAAAGYRKPAHPKDEDLKTLIHSFNKPRPAMTISEAKKAAADIGYLKQWYQNPTKLNLILFMAKDYLQKKQLFTYRGNGDYQFSTDGREIRITPENGKYLIVFKNGTFYRRIASKNDKALTDRLLHNAIFFCVPSGDVESTDEEGNTIYIPRFDVITMCTLYFRDSAEWSASTLLYTTVDETLKVRVDAEKKKVEEQEIDQ